MKIAIGYPPIESRKGTPLLSQNRQFQYFNAPTYIYPMVPAYAASNLKKNSHTVYWLDGIAEKKTYRQWTEELALHHPDFLLIETKAPVIKTHWRQIADIKKRLPNLKVILVGDHVSSFPKESFENSLVDYVITGGDYDFVIVNLLNHITKRDRLEGGIWWREEKGWSVVNSGPPSLKHNLDELPFIDRDLTKWKLYAYENGNYKYTPATYMYSGRDCWYNRCTFCVWDHTLNPLGSYRSFSPERLFAEVKYVVDKLRVKEIFDDAGTFYAGAKLLKFCELMVETGYHKKVRYGCNMRVNALREIHYQAMKKAGFRFVLYGVESFNQKTLDLLQKGTKVEDNIQGPKMAKEAGLDPHVTIMLGYPWEKYGDAKHTIEMAKYAFSKGYYETMQATIVMPYPGTPLWRQCKENNWLLTEDYSRYDMREPIMRVPYSGKKLLELTQELYSSFMTPQYISRKILGIRSFYDFKYLFYVAKKLLAHLVDFDPRQKKVNWTSLQFWKNVSFKLSKYFLIPRSSLNTKKHSIGLADNTTNL